MENRIVVLKNLKESKKNIKLELKPDNLIIFFTRVLEDLKTKEDPEFYGRVKEIFLLIDPYNPLEKIENIFEEFLNHSFESDYGMKLDEQEMGFLNIFRENLDSEGHLKNSKVMKGRIKGMLKILLEKYLPESSKIIEPYILGKLISFVGGIKSLYAKPASAIQLLGSEIALFKHLSTNSPCPKYGLIYHSKFVQSEKNKGRKARKLGNELAKSIRIDYFRNFYDGER